jgi:phosphoribosylanthranilate isomerase
MSAVPKIKFCGITQVADAEHAVTAGAWALGMIFWRGSPRRCRHSRAAEIAAAVRRRVQLAGVFVNPTLAEVDAAVQAGSLTIVQLHGDEGPAFCSEVARRTGAQVIKAARVRSRADIQALAQFHTAYHLLDGYSPAVRGGTGETFAWELASGHRGRMPLILSGGLTPDNVADAIAAVQPWAVDVASGVESAAGIKDPARVSAFAKAVRSCAPDALARADAPAGTA